MAEKMKGITCCGDCIYYDWKKHRCKRGCTSEIDPHNSFFDDCVLPEVREVVYGKLKSTGMGELYAEFGDCSVCGGDNYIKAKYCNWCGAKLRED